MTSQRKIVSPISSSCFKPAFFPARSVRLVRGKNGRYDKYPTYTSGSQSFVDPDDKVTLQILRIGANIIDQWGSENFPTTITFTYAAPAPAVGTTYVNVEGIKDLPTRMRLTSMSMPPITGLRVPLPRRHFYRLAAL